MESRAALIVVDMQNGFLNAHTQHLVDVVSALVDQWSAAGLPVVFTRYLNYPGSPFERLINWTRLQSSPETDIAPGLAAHQQKATAVIDKPAYSWFTPRAVSLAAEERWTDLVFCGVATDSCVLKSAADAFERGFTPWIVTDACASDAGPETHNAGLHIARRFIGAGQLVTTEQALDRFANTTPTRQEEHLGRTVQH